MITGLRLRNFKAFADTGHVEIAPLTILMGANSSGKSALLRALMAVRQTVESPDPQAAFVPTGRFVDLGPFPEFVFKHNDKAAVHIEVTSTMPARSPDTTGSILTTDQREGQVTTSIELRYIYSTDRVYLARSTMTGDFTDRAVAMRKESMGGKQLGRKYRSWSVSPDGTELRLPDTTEAKFYSVPPLDFGFSFGDEASTSTDRRRRARIQQLMAAQWASGVEKLVTSEMSGLLYIGPLRARPQRIYISTGEALREVGSAGELGPSVLWSLSEVPGLELLERLTPAGTRSTA